MKNLKQFILMAFIGIFGIAVTFVACDNGNGENNDPKCNCPNGTVHTDVSCSCNAVGYGCNCTYQPILLPYTYSGIGTYPQDFKDSFTIEKMTDANQAKADVIIKHLIGGYNHEDWSNGGIIPTKKLDFLNKINTIILNNSSTLTYNSYDPNRILYIGVNFNLNAYIVDGFSSLEQYLAYAVICWIADGNEVSLSQIKTISPIELAKHFDNLKYSVRFSMGKTENLI